MSIPRPSPSSSSADQVFHLFPSLPLELRLKIWQYNLPQSRVVSIRLESASPLDRHPNPRGHRGCLSSAQIPVNLHVCAEARSEALRQYSLSFGIATQSSQVFFNPERDILYFGSRDGFKATECQFKLFTSMVGPEELAHVRRLAINDSIFWSYPEYMSTIAADITVDVLNIVRSRFPNLDELIFVPKDENPVYGDATFVEPLLADSRLLHQVHEGMQIVVQTNPEWRVPEWSVRVLSTVKQFCDSDMTMAIDDSNNDDDSTMQEIEEAVTQYLSPMDRGILNCFQGHQSWAAPTIYSSNEHFLGPLTSSIGHW